MSNKILNILGIATKVMTFIVVTVISVISLVMAYIMFAPDDLPKPFHLVYDYSGGAQTAAALEPAATPTPEARVFHPGEGVMVNMATKIINLADPAGRKYIRLTMVLEFAPDNPEYDTLPEEEKNAYLTDFENRLNARMPIMDDTVITLLSTKTFDELYTADGKEMLRLQIMQAIAQRMPDLQILSVYFTEFVVQ